MMGLRMQEINTVMVRALRGAPISCLIAIALARQPVGNQWLTRVTGYSDKPISEAMKTLKEFGLVVTNGRYDSWRLADNNFQLPFSIEGTRNNSDSQPTTTTAYIEESNENEQKKKKGTRNNSDSIIFELRKAKIYEPTASELAGLNWVTLEYIRAHVQRAISDNTPTGLLVHRIRSGDDAPETIKRNNRRRYIEGEYKDMIAH